MLHTGGKHHIQGLSFIMLILSVTDLKGNKFQQIVPPTLCETGASVKETRPISDLKMIHAWCLNQKEEHLWNLMSEGVFKFKFESKSNMPNSSPGGNLKGE